MSLRISDAVFTNLVDKTDNKSDAASVDLTLSRSFLLPNLRLVEPPSNPGARSLIMPTRDVPAPYSRTGTTNTVFWLHADARQELSAIVFGTFHDIREHHQKLWEKQGDMGLLVHYDKDRRDGLHYLRCVEPQFRIQRNPEHFTNVTRVILCRQEETKDKIIAILTLHLQRAIGIRGMTLRRIGNTFAVAFPVDTNGQEVARPVTLGALLEIERVVGAAFEECGTQGWNNINVMVDDDGALHTAAPIGNLTQVLPLCESGWNR